MSDLGNKLAFSPVNSQLHTSPARRILVVDDDWVNRRLFSVGLTNHGFLVETLEDGTRVREKIREFQPDLVLLDLMMPTKGGFVVLLELKQDPELASVPIVIFSAKSQAEDIENCLRHGAAAYLIKPVSARELRECIERLLPPQVNPSA